MSRRTGLLFLAAVCVFWISGTALAESKRILIVASYEKNHICGWPQEQGVIKGLAKEGWFEGLNLEVKRFYMDTKRTNTTLKAMKKAASKVLKAMDAYRPQLLVTLDDNAFREVGLKMANHPDINVVFSGMNGQPEKYNKVTPYMKNREHPGGNITGVYEKLYVARSIRVMESAVRGLKGGVIVGITDYSPTGNAIYPVALTLKVSEDLTYTAPEIFKWTVENSKKPEMALNYFFAKIGLFGGAAVDFQKMGFMAGKKAGKILNGEKAGSLPVEDAPDYAIVFNIKRAAQLGIDIPDPLLTAADHVYNE